MTKPPPTIASHGELVEPSPLSDPYYRERLRTLCLEPPEQCELFDVRGQYANQWMRVCLSESLEYIEHVLTDLQVECHHSMSLGEAYGRSLERVRALEAELVPETTDHFYEHLQSHFELREWARDGLMRAASSAVISEFADLTDRMEIAVQHGGEWGCEIWIGAKASSPPAGVLITLDPAGEDLLTVTCRSIGDDIAGCLHLSGQLLRRIFSSLDVTSILVGGRG